MSKPLNSDLQFLFDFLKTATPKDWIEYAVEHLPILLIDHAHCERKAAATALNFISKYPEKEAVVEIMSPLAREELLHFEKVIAILQQKNIAFSPLKPSNYAQQLHQHVAANNGKERLRDQLIIGAIIEARSCERFYQLIPHLNDPHLVRFYRTLVKSEARHFENYLHLAQRYGGEINQRLDFFLHLENEFICSKDTVFRFHSGIPGSL
ncbi:tRNA-(ms[2]io[6]A)-hydroxylase [Legionella israelensis]|uniref:tRNA-(Ms(2)io(6)A)-hydroxylase n=1 Tax=Legionella israelensis TaxID=454 RepID=A0A0W0W3D5_9GAMM|nr:tRNA-(ms[2]io[6]A)-hydroxylase [Legionella israelensis]KTD26856.1 tRNA-(ms(2)io(6)A)-hydroxylase [Legionella israelensis]QBR84261.1 tRNA-(ms[2]io[6]A)-hydroxylase [Legionella israelensis]QBS08524.1 tRNA-(ms[2]io[6]A)-hydroxylase [Legionella israelensis]SCX76705.1 tRNA-(ms[2]io[6]A)-hydroxylase [Legionella israelensis DSM 19235]STX58174.1 tRNA-(ms(2)io(6)a)-hydrolase(tRNA hydroxylase) [Legionella israelensis]